VHRVAFVERVDFTARGDFDIGVGQDEFSEGLDGEGC
jgi:hypothetical protein